ncbi:TniB family NTP-binding protein [Pseudomonas izuensis]|uniref:TniB family NTP-binding protein n=1 Tax=Pseudomonas izuensis TaxID=2684212 RepID=UPI001FE36BCD|nr:TniB family NTP-binding protein [Pseudomonas izuensis]
MSNPIENGSYDKQRRISYLLQEFWIDCPHARKTLNAILTMLEIPPRTTAPCMLVCGEGGTGKTSIVTQLQKMNRGLGSPLVFMTLTENSGKLKFKQLIVEAIGLPMKLGAGRETLSKEIASYIHSHGIRGIVIDEFHESLIVPKTEQLRNLSLLKGLSGSPYNLSIIGFGVGRAKNALLYDDQLARRYYMRELPMWSLNEDFRNFVATLEKRFNLKNPSQLHQEDMLRLIYELSKGVMDRLVKMLTTAACYAIATGVEVINREMIKLALEDDLGYKEFLNP